MGAYGPTTINIDKFFRSIKGSKTEKKLKKDLKNQKRKGVNNARLSLR